jgi:hypothetical protein
MSDAPTSTRREFVKVAGTAALGASLFPTDALAQPRPKRRYATVGTGDRGSGMWGRDLVQRYPDLLEVVGLVSTSFTAPITSAAGTGCGKTAGRCWCTRPAITSI